MRLTVASTCSPFGDPPSRPFVDDLVDLLRAQDHAVAHMWLPMDPDPARTLQRYLALALTDVTDAGELMITVRAPSHLLRHPRKVVWFEPDPLGWDKHGGSRLRADRIALADAERVFSTSAEVADTLRRSAGISSPVLDPARLKSDPTGVLAALLG